MGAKNMFYPEDKKFSKADERAYAREELVYNVTEDILILLENSNINKKELAERLGKSRSYVTQLLSGARNMTLGSLSDICFAIGIKPKINLSVTTTFDTGINIRWKNDDVDIKVDNLIQKSVNIIDCREHKSWTNDTKAA